MKKSEKYLFQSQRSLKIETGLTRSDYEDQTPFGVFEIK